jgi:hypothetical protein
MSDCVAPEEIWEGDLLAFVEGEASPAVRDHVARCSACAQEAAGLQQVNLLFAAVYDRANCPASELLLRYQAGLLTPAVSKHAKRHVQDCQDCQGELAELAGEPSPSTLNRLATAVSQSLKEAGRQVIVAVLLPGKRQPALALRGESQQQAIYQAGPYQIILAKVSPLAVRKAWQVEGQLTGQGSEQRNGRVSLQRGEVLIASDNLDEFGFFALEEVPPGRYTLQIEIASSLVSLADLTIP